MKEKVFCKNCKGNRNHAELHKIERRGGEEESGYQYIHTFLLIKCNGCDNISFLETYGDTEMFNQVGDYGDREYYDEKTVYPQYLEKGDEIYYKNHLPKTIRVIYSETISAFKSNSSILTAGGLRAIIEAICNHLKISGNNLAERIDALSKNGHLTASESKRLHSIRFLGNDALHEMEIPKKEHLYLLLGIINHLLTNLFINDKIMKGKVDTMVDDFDEFIRTVENKIEKEMIGKKFTLFEILKKSKRLLTKKHLDEFEKKLIKELENGDISFLKVIKEKDIIFYEVVEEPMLFNFGIN